MNNINTKLAWQEWGMLYFALGLQDEPYCVYHIRHTVCHIRHTRHVSYLTCIIFKFQKLILQSNILNCSLVLYWGIQCKKFFFVSSTLISLPSNLKHYILLIATHGLDLYDADPCSLQSISLTEVGHSSPARCEWDRI